MPTYGEKYSKKKVNLFLVHFKAQSQHECERTEETVQPLSKVTASLAAVQTRVKFRITDTGVSGGEILHRKWIGIK